MFFYQFFPQNNTKATNEETPFLLMKCIFGYHQIKDVGLLLHQWCFVLKESVGEMSRTQSEVRKEKTMAGQGASLQNYNNELVKCIEDLREKREEINRQILKEEEEKVRKS